MFSLSSMETLHLEISVGRRKKNECMKRKWAVVEATAAKKTFLVFASVFVFVFVRN